MSYQPGNYWMLCQRTGRRIRRSDAVIDPQSGYIVHRDCADKRHPQETMPPPRIERVPTFVSPEPSDTFLGENDVTTSDL